MLLHQSFYRRDALVVARELLGAVLIRDEVSLRITEVEAYRWPEDSANHCHKGPTERNAPMRGPAGRAYVYLCYGIHHLFNVVTGLEGQGAAVLIRGCEPVAGLETISARRGGRSGPVLLNGPGKVGAALALDTSWSNHPIYQAGGLELHAGVPPETILVGPRVGIDFAAPAHRDAPWRLAIGGSPWVSQRRHLRPEPPRASTGASGPPEEPGR